MDQAIAAEWGRFLRELEARGNEGLKKNTDSAGDGAGVLAPAPNGPQASDAIAPPAEQLDSVRPQDATDAERSLGQPYARPAAENSRNSWLRHSQSVSSSAPEPQHTMTSEVAKYATQTQWNGTTFEERRVLVRPAEEAPVLEPQVTTIHEEAVEQKEEAVEQKEEAVEQKAPSAPVGNLEGEMWNSATRMDSAVTEGQASNADAMQAAQGQEASRWFVLKGMLGGSEVQEKTPDQSQTPDVPVLEVFSLAGGVGKTSLVAALGRVLSARGEHVLLVEATFLGSLQYFFGATDCRPGAVRTFRPPAASSDAPIRLATVDPDALLVESAVQGSLATDIQRWAQGASRVIVDVATGATAIARGLLQSSTVVLVPLIPDIHAIVTPTSIDAFFQRNAGVPNERSQVYYLLNQFDPSLPLHLDVREVLREKLGDRMLPFALPRTPAISEALAEGMTIMDYAPDSPATEDFIGLAKWLDDVLAPVDMNRRGMRWSER